MTRTFAEIAARTLRRMVEGESRPQQRRKKKARRPARHRQQKARRTKPKSVWVTGYDKYLASATWRAVRAKALAFHGERCQHRSPQCAGPIQVHHLTYKRVGGKELMTDLAVVCKRHHEALHGRA